MSELAPLLLGLVLRPLSFGHVADDDDETGLPCHLDGLRHHDRAPAAALAGAHVQLEFRSWTPNLQPAVPCLAVLDAAEQVQLRHGLADSFLTAESEHRLPALVDLDEPGAGLAHDRHGIGARVKGPAEAFFRASERLLDGDPLVNLLLQSDHSRRKLDRPLGHSPFEIGAGISQRLLHYFLVFDIGTGAVPPDHSAFLVQHRAGTGQVPAILAGRPHSDPVLDLERFSGPHSFGQRLNADVAVVRMGLREPALLADFPMGDPGELVPPAVEVLELAVGPHRPDDLRHRIGQLPQPGLAFAQGSLIAAQLLIAFSLGDVHVDAEHVLWPPDSVVEGLPFRQHPAGAGVVPLDPELALVGSPLLDRPLNGLR